MRKMKKFAGGGSDRYKARYDRKVADIKSDYQKALRGGKNPDVAEAKRAQRMADADDDFAKWTGKDRTQTRVAEQRAEQALTTARINRNKPRPRNEVSVPQAAPAIKAPGADTVSAAKTPSAEPATFAEAFRAARKDKGAGQTFMWKGKSYTTDYASEAKPKAPPTRATKPAPKVSAPAPRSRMGTFRTDIEPPSDIAPGMKKGGAVKKFAKGGKVDGCAIRGKTRAPMRKK